jgi:hypothetical protein
MRQHGAGEAGRSSVFMQVFLTRRSRRALRIFDLGDAERALARFAELTAG